MKKNLIIVSLLVGIILALATPKWTQATLISSDFLSAGDGLLVTDDSTGIEWLSPMATLGVSYNQITVGWGNLVTTHNFEYATSTQAVDMLTTNGITSWDTSFTASLYEPVGEIMSVFGSTVPANINMRVINGRTKTEEASNPGKILMVNLSQFPNYTCDGSGPGIENCGSAWHSHSLWKTTQVANGGSWTGSWLMRSGAGVPVPEPSTMLLLGTGLIGLVGFNYKRKNQTT